MKETLSQQFDTCGRSKQKWKEKKQKNGPKNRKNERIAFIKKEKNTKTHPKSPTEKRAARRPAPRAKKGPKKAQKEEKTQTKTHTKSPIEKKKQHGAQHPGPKRDTKSTARKRYYATQREHRKKRQKRPEPKPKKRPQKAPLKKKGKK